MRFKLIIHFFLLYFCALQSIEAHALDEKECRVSNYPHQIKCGKLDTNFKNGINQHEKLKIDWFKVSARVRYPLPEPIIWIPDGFAVNTSNTSAEIIYTLSRLRNNRDLIWLDFNSVIIDSTCNDTKPLMLSEKISKYHDANYLQNCHQELVNYGNLNDFSYENIALYYEQLRKQLGLKQVTIYAEGRGANIALAWSEIAPESIKLQVIDNANFKQEYNLLKRSTRVENSLKAVFNRCQQDNNCNKNFPNSVSSLISIFEQLPKNIEVTDPISFKKTNLLLTEELFYQGILTILGKPNQAKLLPFLIEKAAKNDWQPFIGILSLGWSKNQTKTNYLMNLAEQCVNQEYQHDNGSVSHLSKIASWIYRVEINRLNKLCPTGIFSKSKVNKTVSSVPTLMLIGSSALINPSYQSILKNYIEINVNGAGSSVLTYGCAKDVLYRYFMWQTKFPNKKIDVSALDAKCLLNIPYPSMEYVHTANGVLND